MRYVLELRDARTNDIVALWDVESDIEVEDSNVDIWIPPAPPMTPGDTLDQKVAREIGFAERTVECGECGERHEKEG